VIALGLCKRSRKQVIRWALCTRSRNQVIQLSISFVGCPNVRRSLPRDGWVVDDPFVHCGPTDRLAIIAARLECLSQRRK
jgi:hypothetical protein